MDNKLTTTLTEYHVVSLLFCCVLLLKINYFWLFSSHVSYTVTTATVNNKKLDIKCFHHGPYFNYAFLNNYMNYIKLVSMVKCIIIQRIQFIHKIQRYNKINLNNILLCCAPKLPLFLETALFGTLSVLCK